MSWMRGRGPFGLMVALACGLLVPACRRKAAQKPVVIGIEVVDRSPDPKLDRAQLTSKAVQVLEQSGLFDVSLGQQVPSDRKGWRCRIEVSTGLDQAGSEGVLRGAARARCGSSSGDSSETFSAEALGDRPYKAGEGSQAALENAHAIRLTGDTLGLVVRQVRLRTGPMPDLLAALRDQDADVRRMALRAAASRKAREAIADVAKLLQDSQSDIRDLALGTLMDIGDPQAVKAIASQVRFEDKEEVRRTIGPISTLGGEEARTFLEFVATGNEDPEIRKMAAQALERMARAKRPSPP